MPRHEPGTRLCALALVPDLSDCIEAAQRIVGFVNLNLNLNPNRAPRTRTVNDTMTLQSLIDAAFERRSDITPGQVPKDLSDALSRSSPASTRASSRGREDRRRLGDPPVVEEGRAAAFRAHDNRVIDGGATNFDKVPMRFAGYSDAEFRQEAFASCRRPWRGPARSSGRTS